MRKSDLKILDYLEDNRDVPGKQIKDATKLSSGTIYVRLARLEDEKLVSSRWEEGIEPPPEFRRRLYRITDEGRRRRIRPPAKRGFLDWLIPSRQPSTA